MPFAYEGTILDALPLGVQAILRPLTPEIGELSEGIIEFLLDKTEQMQALVTISNIITSDAAEALNFLYHNMASVDIEDEDIIHDVWIIRNLIKQFQDNPDLPIKDADEKRIELLLTLDNLEEVLRKMQTK